MNPPTFWRERSPGERRLLAWGTGAAIVLLFVAFAWLPMERARARLEHEVPVLRATVATLARDAEEVERLRALPPAATASAPAASLSALAAGSITAPPGSRITAVDERHLRLAADDASFTALVEWIATVAPAERLRVERAHLEALAEPGRVRAELTFVRP